MINIAVDLIILGIVALAYREKFKGKYERQMMQYQLNGRDKQMIGSFLKENTEMGEIHMKELTIKQAAERSKKIREHYRSLEMKHHGSEWSVEEDALAFLTDVG